MADTFFKNGSSQPRSGRRAPQNPDRARGVLPAWAERSRPHADAWSSPSRRGQLPGTVRAFPEEAGSWDVATPWRWLTSGKEASPKLDPTTPEPEGWRDPKVLKIGLGLAFFCHDVSGNPFPEPFTSQPCGPSHWCSTCGHLPNDAACCACKAVGRSNFGASKGAASVVYVRRLFKMWHAAAGALDHQPSSAGWECWRIDITSWC